MKPLLTILQSATLLLASLATSAFGQNSGVKQHSITAEPDDCIEEIVNNDRVFSVRTRKGHLIAVYRDENKRPSIFVKDQFAYKAKYDAGEATKILSMEPLNGGPEIPVSYNGLTPASSETKKMQPETIQRKIDVCRSRNPNRTQPKANGGDLPSVIAAGGGGFYYGEDWAAAGFYNYYVSDPYWIEEQRPYFEEAMYTFDQHNNPRQACVQQVSSCNDACDVAADLRSISCAIGTMFFMEIPIGAGLYGIACAAASIYHKNECKNSCPALTGCF